ncbi:MAG TPA: HAD family hydrolase [Pirellulales bacterium]|nr:HAD family hydrolase [Pirellulales bacterium]
MAEVVRRRRWTFRIGPICLAAIWFCALAAAEEGDPLPSWNEGEAKQAILKFVRATTDPESSEMVPADERIATFDNDGTLWVEHPMYTQMMYCIDRLKSVVEQRPELKEKSGFKAVLSGDREAIAHLGMDEMKEIFAVTLAGMTVDEFQADAAHWLATAKSRRFDRLYTELVYQPMLEVLALFRAHGFKTYIVTGGGQDFVRVFAQRVYGIPPEQVIGTAGVTKYGYDKAGQPQLTKEPKLLFIDDQAGKPEGINLLIGRRPVAAFGNSIGDRQMLEYTTAGSGSRLGMLLLHDDAEREFAYGPAENLPATRVGEFTQALHDEATMRSWTVIRMQRDWKTVFKFEK